MPPGTTTAWDLEASRRSRAPHRESAYIRPGDAYAYGRGGEGYIGEAYELHDVPHEVHYDDDPRVRPVGIEEEFRVGKPIVEGWR